MRIALTANGESHVQISPLHCRSLTSMLCLLQGELSHASQIVGRRRSCTRSRAVGVSWTNYFTMGIAHWLQVILLADERLAAFVGRRFRMIVLSGGNMSVGMNRHVSSLATPDTSRAVGGLKSA